MNTVAVAAHTVSLNACCFPLLPSLCARALAQWSCTYGLRLLCAVCTGYAGWTMIGGVLLPRMASRTCRRLSRDVGRRHRAPYAASTGIYTQWSAVERQLHSKTDGEDPLSLWEDTTSTTHSSPTPEQLSTPDSTGLISSVESSAVPMDESNGRLTKHTTPLQVAEQRLSDFVATAPTSSRQLQHVQYRGAYFELLCAVVLCRDMGFVCERVGGAGDEGIDLRGSVHSSAAPVNSDEASEQNAGTDSKHLSGAVEQSLAESNVLIQCKWEGGRPLSPKHIRELEGVVVKNRLRTPLYASHMPLTDHGRSGSADVDSPRSSSASSSTNHDVIDQLRHNSNTSPTDTDSGTASHAELPPDKLSYPLGVIASREPFSASARTRLLSSSLPLLGMCVDEFGVRSLQMSPLAQQVLHAVFRLQPAWARIGEPVVALENVFSATPHALAHALLPTKSWQRSTKRALLVPR